MNDRTDREYLKRNREKLKNAKRALNFVAQESFAKAAADYIREGESLLAHPSLRAVVEDDILHRHVFGQKTPPILRFYRQLFAGLTASPQSILEIGVKNGGSLALWRQLFPEARIVGLDVGLAKAVKHNGIDYVTGDQTDLDCLANLAQEHGPFDLVIDDGSHIGADQLSTLRYLLRRMLGGGIYVIEDVHTGLKPGRTELYGPDVWADFTGYVFDYLRGYPTDIAEPSTPLTVAIEVAPMVSSLVLAHKTLALHIRPPSQRSPAETEAQEELAAI